MKRLQQAGGTVLTGDALADAVLEYARALGNRHTIDLVDIPVVNERRGRVHAQILVGSGIQLMSVSASSMSPELLDQAAVDAIRRQAADLRVARARPFRQQGCPPRRRIRVRPVGVRVVAESPGHR